MKQVLLYLLISLLCAGAYAQTVADIARRERDVRAPLLTLTAERATTPADIGALKDDVFRFYDVRGATAAELRTDIARQGPISEGTRQQGFTNWRINWQPLTVSSGGKCSVASMNVSLTVEMVIPRWVNEVGAQTALSEGWRQYLTGLLLHEHGHKDIAIAAAEEVRQLSKTANPQATCAAAIAVADAAGKAIVDKTVARQRQYDKETEHGRGQGVRLP